VIKITVIGKTVGGTVSGKVQVRLHSGAKIDVGDLLSCKDEKTGDKFFMKVVNMGMFSLVGSQFIEDIAGQKLEHGVDYNFFEKEDRFYRICEAKILKIARDGRFVAPRCVPGYFTDVRTISEDEFSFVKLKGEIPIGHLRLGTDSYKGVSISLPANKLISHHMLVVAATGKGKSNFSKVFLRGILNLDDYSSIVFDPHNEYYGGRGIKGLRDHAKRDKILYFSPRPLDTPGAEALKICTEDIKPEDFIGIIDLSTPQQEAMDLLSRKFGKTWVKTLLDTNAGELEDLFEKKIYRATISTLKRKLYHALELDGNEGLVFSTNPKSSVSVYDQIKQAITQRKVVIIDTSMISEETEKVINSSIVHRVYEDYRIRKQADPQFFSSLPEVLIVFEEAPRVLGADALAKGTNIFERIAREGRKFKVGLCAITQMPSLLPREILSQMNTKVILGLPSPMDRDAVINSSSQNISDEGAEVQMLDKGEAIITSPFIDFPLPTKIFLFEDVLKEDGSKIKEKNFSISVG